MNALKSMVMAVMVMVTGLAVANAGEIVNQNDQVVCSQCYKGKTIPVEGADEASFYTQIAQTPNFAFIQENMGSSCPGGGWSIIDKRVPNPSLQRMETGCKEISTAKAFESNGMVFFKATQYDGKTVVYKYKM